jgi:anti-sigma-K factor RskA
MDREDMLDQVAALALGILPAEEARRVRTQIAFDEALFREYQDYRGVADLVGFAAEAKPITIDDLLGERMKSNVMKAVRAQTGPAPQTGQRRAGMVWPAYVAAVIALAAAFVAVLDSLSIRKALDAERQFTVALRRQVDVQNKLADAQRAQIADLFAPNSKHYPVNGGEVITHEGRIYIAMRNLPKLAPGKVFQVWTLARGAKAVAPSITFTPNATGSAIVRIPGEHLPVAAVAVSVEPQGGSKAPTSTPTFIRPLT